MTNSVAAGVAYTDPALIGATIDNSTIGSTTKAAGAFTTLNATGATTLNGTVMLGDAGADTVGFYGYASSAQRAYSSAVHATSAVASSAAFGATQAAALQEVMKTFIALGVWATA